MFALRLISSTNWALWLSLVAASLATQDEALHVRGNPATFHPDTLKAIRRALSILPADKRSTSFTNTTTFGKTYSGAVLFQDTFDIDVDSGDGDGTVNGTIDITCTTCYITGSATVQVSIDSGFNVTAAFDSAVSDVETIFENITDIAISDIKNATESVVEAFLTSGHIPSFDTILNSLDFPTIPIDFNLDIQGLPGCHLHFQLDGMELYVLLDLALSSASTYTVNIFTSESPLGISIGDELQLGIFFTIDLIVDLDEEINISTGFHIRLDDGAAIDINMFDTNVSSITLNGGTFEFLPVTVATANGTLNAVLQLGIHAGFEVSTESFHDIASFSAGVEAGVFANVADLTTTFSDASASSQSDSGDCEVTIVEVYEFAIGADAGATLALGDHTWGPTPDTTLPIFYTTLADACATRGTPTESPSPTAIQRKNKRLFSDSDTTVLTKTDTYTAVACASRGLINCPASLQSTSLATVTSTLAVSGSGSATWPATTGDDVTTVPFRTGARSLLASSGSPVSYVPVTHTPSAGGGGGSGGGGGGGVFPGVLGLSTKDKLAIGLSIGLGLPFLTAIAAGCFFFQKRRKAARDARAHTLQVSQVPAYTPEPYTPEPYTPYTPDPSTGYFHSIPRKPVFNQYSVSVVENH